eukprot:356594-Chlamydomonas_euryale.AAC.10
MSGMALRWLFTTHLYQLDVMMRTHAVLRGAETTIWSVCLHLTADGQGSRLGLTNTPPRLLLTLLATGVYRSLGMNITDGELNDMIVEFDLDKDGMISEEEFMVGSPVHAGRSAACDAPSLEDS